jgi:hypothetical protein
MRPTEYCAAMAIQYAMVFQLQEIAEAVSANVVLTASAIVSNPIVTAT